MRRIRSRIASLGAATVLAVAASVAMTSPAHAFTCPTGKVCNFSGLNFTGAEQTTDHAVVGHCVPVRFTAHSTENRTSHVLGLFLDGSCGVPTGADVPPLSDVPADDYGSYRYLT
ncbi:peptidase inhibitor family I36 protein [Streptomyces sp. NPDC001719]